MLTCSKKSLLLVLALVVVAVQIPCTDADATATIEVDGANVTLDNTVCPNAAWRTSSLYAKVTPAGDIKFEAEYNNPYYQQYMKPKVVPNLILLVVTLLLFLFFIFWRWIYCCCTCCCNLCKPSPEPMKFIRDRGMTATKVIACLMALGVLAAGCFGMANTGPHLVNQAVATIGTFTGFADDIFGAAYNITTDANKALGIFDDLITILNVDVNVTGMNSDITCIATWLNGMADPTTIANGLGTLDTYIDGPFHTITTDVTSDLTAYAASGADYDLLTGPYMGYVTSQTPFWSNYQTQVNSFISDAGALVTPGAWSGRTPAQDTQIATTGSALSTLADGVGSLAIKHSTTSNDYAGLQALQTLVYDAGHTTLSGSSTPTMLALKNNLNLLIGTDTSGASNLYYHQLPYLITDLSQQSTDYAATQPCMDTFLYQIEHINETVVALPPAAETSYELLEMLDSTFEIVMTSPDTNPATMSAALLAYQATLFVGTGSGAIFGPVNTTYSELNRIIGYIGASSVSDYSNLISAVNQLRSDTQTSPSSTANTDVQSASSTYAAYVASPTSTNYQAFYTAAHDNARVSLGTVQTDLQRITTTRSADVTASITLANNIISAQSPALPTPAAVQSVVTAITTAQAAIPAREPYVVSEAAEGAAYDALPNPKGAVLNSISVVVSDLNSKISSTTTEVRADIASYDAMIIDKIVTLHNDTVDRITDKENEYLPKVRHYDGYRMKGEYIYFAIVMFFAVVLIIVVVVNYQWGASFFTFLLLLAMLIYGIFSTVLLLLAHVGHDECSNAETQIFTALADLDLNSGSFNATALAGYYILGEGGSLNNVTQTAAGVNFAAIKTTINNTIQQTITGITGAYTLRYKLQDEVNDVSALGVTLFNDLAFLQTLVEFENVHPLYLGAKQLACCDVVDLVGNLWLSMFMAGWFSVVLVVAMFCYIRRLDELPRKRCCGCAFRSYKEFLEPEDRRLAAIKNKGKYMPAGREGSAPGTSGALSATAIKVGPTGSFAGGLISGVSNMSNTSADSARPIKAGFSEFNSDGTPRNSATPRESAYLLPPESPRAERSSDSQNRASLLGVQPLSVEGSGGSLLSPSSSKKGSTRQSFATKTEEKKADLKRRMRMNQLE